LEIILRERAPKHDNSYTGQPPYDLERGKFPHLTRLALARLPLCLFLQLILRLKGSAMQYLGIDAGRLLIDICEDHRHLCLGEDRSVSVQTLQFRGFQSPSLRKELVEYITTSLQFPNIKDFYVDVRFGDNAPVSISSLELGNLSPKKIVIGTSNGYRVDVVVSPSKGALPTIRPSASTSIALESPQSVSDRMHEAILPTRVTLNASNLNTDLYFKGFSERAEAGLERLDEINIIVDSLEFEQRIAPMLQYFNEGPPFPRLPRRSSSRKRRFLVRVARTFQRVKWSFTKMAQNTILYPELQRVTIHVIASSKISELPDPIVKELKTMVRKRKGKASLKEIRWKVPPPKQDIQWFRRQGITCSTTSDRDYIA
jgi:hypothetical protein